MTTARGRLARAGAGLVVLASVAGCGGGTTPVPTPTPTPSSAQAGGSGISPPDLPTPPALTNAQGAVADVTVGSCATTAGTQQVTGTVKNPTDTATDYVITINWTNNTYDVAGRGVAVVKDLKPGATADWKLTGKVANGATRCTPNVLRGTLKN